MEQSGGRSRRRTKEKQERERERESVTPAPGKKLAAIIIYSTSCFLSVPLPRPSSLHLETPSSTGGCCAQSHIRSLAPPRCRPIET